MPGVPEQIGPYRVERAIGRGGMGVVYLARDERLGRVVAIKALPPEFVADAERAGRFEREARLIASLNHPNIATVYALEEIGPERFLVMEYIEGPTLAERLRQGLLPMEEALGIASQLAEGIEAAHESGLVHRDLKPSNIKIRPDGLVKVLDFGLAHHGARRVGESAASTAPVFTREGELLGTPGYMSPEQARGRHTDRRTDIFAFGCILFEMLAGRPAFGGQTPTECVASLLKESPDWRLLPAPLAGSLRQLLERCLEKDASKRLRDIGDARMEIEGAMDDLETRSGANGSERSVAPAAPAPTPRNLPRQITSFIGRETELHALESLILERPLVTLTGSGGCGKTRLAMRTAERAAGHFPDGVWMIDLSAVNEARNIASTAAAAIGGGIRAFVGRGSDQSGAASTGDEMLRTVIGYLRSRRCLLILDNCEHLIDGCVEFVSGVLDGCEHVHVLATSRQALGIHGEQSYRVPSLEVAHDEASATPDLVAATDAARLFVDRARLCRPDFIVDAGNAGAVAKVCRRLDGIPFAIELAASRVGSMSVHDLAGRIDDIFRALPTGTRAAIPRQATLHALIDWSHRLLSEAESTLLFRASVFAGGWTLAAAERVCGEHAEIAGEPIAQLLSRLVERSLVVYDPHETGDRYRMLETVRQFVRNRDRADGIEALRERHLDWVLGLVEDVSSHLYGKDQHALFARLTVEHENCRLAMETSLRRINDPQAALRIAHALHHFWHLCGHLREGCDFTRQALACPGPADSALQGKAFNALGILSGAAGDHGAARSAYESSLGIWRERGEHSRVAAVLTNVGIAANALGNAEASAASHSEALKTYESLGDERGAAAARLNLGHLDLTRGELDRAAERNRDALVAFQRLGDDLRVSACLLNLGEIARRRGRIAEAVGLLRQSIEVKRRVGDETSIAYCLMLLGLCAIDLGLDDQAIALLASAESMRTETGAGLNPSHGVAVEEALARLRASRPDPQFRAQWASTCTNRDWSTILRELESRASASGSSGGPAEVSKA